MKLRLGKSQGFVIEGKRAELYPLTTIPDSRYFDGEGVLRLPENTTSWRALSGLKFSKTTITARNRLKSLGDEYRDSRRRIKRASRKFKQSSQGIEVPLVHTPYSHQARAIGYCTESRDSALFGDTGTGKTLIAIAVTLLRYLSGEVKRVLIVCPKGVLPVWPREYVKHSQLPVEVAIKGFPQSDNLNVSVINYDSYWRMKKEIFKWKPDMVIYDESHRLKSPSGKAARFGMGLHSRVKFKLIMTGTPWGKCVTEMYSQYAVMNQDVFGKSLKHFKGKYCQMGGFMNKKVVGINNEKELKKKVHENSFRMIKSECLDLPPVSYQNLYVEPDRFTKQIYSQMEKELFLELEGNEITAPGEAVRNMKLRQILGGSIKTDNESVVKTSQLKMNVLKELLEERRGDKTLVFFSFKQEIVLAQKLASDLGMKYITLQGSTPDNERMTFEDRFQDDSTVELAFINIQCGAEGITLTAANMAIFYSPTYSFIWHYQARDRIHRIGQERPCTWVNILFTGTIDEEIAKVLESNGRLADIQLNQLDYSLKTKRKEPIMAKQATGYKASELAEELGITATVLRGHLRALEIEKPEAGWVWPKKTDKSLATIRKQVKERIAALAKAAKAKADAPTTKADPTQPDVKQSAKQKKAAKAKVEDEAEEKAPAKKGKGKKAAAKK